VGIIDICYSPVPREMKRKKGEEKRQEREKRERERKKGFSFNG
jgi:hypothetical protein